MKKISPILLISLLVISGCATPQAIRQAQFLSSTYDEQIEKNIFVISLIDARPDKKKDLQKLFSNKPTFDQFILKPLRVKGYVPKIIQVDTSVFNSLSGINNVNEISGLDKKLFENGNLFLLISIDQYTAPKKMGIIGNTQVTGVIYSKEQDKIIWKDSIGGNYGYGGKQIMAFGPGGYVGMLLLKGMSQDLTLRYSAFSTIQVLLDSLPPFPKKGHK